MQPTHGYRADLPTTLLTVAQVRQRERDAIAQLGDDFVLMRRAAKAAWDTVCDYWPKPGCMAVMLGAGNNAGDGLLLAILAQQGGWQVVCYDVLTSTQSPACYQRARQEAMAAGVVIESWEGRLVGDVDLLVDGLLGIGLDRELSPSLVAAIDTMNAHAVPVLALDIATGLCADRGIVLGASVQATVTVTFLALKRGLFTAEGPDVSGHIHCAPLTCAQWLPTATMADDVCQRISANLHHRPAEVLPKRRGNGHKGMYGHALVVGGDHGMGGAVLLAAEACARSGAGRTRCATRAAHVAPLLQRCPEVMVHEVVSGLALQALLPSVTAIACGPGLGLGSWSELLLQIALQTDLPLVLDADALTMLSSPSWQQTFVQREVILTPHPGEAARLLGVSTHDIQQDRFAAASALSQRYQAVVVLKGQGTLIASPEGRLALCSDGNAGMSSAGMGDVLTGVIVAALAQGLDAWRAACVGVCAHSHAADVAAQQGMRGMLASDVVGQLRGVIN